ncbi:hypothetical protein [Silicimonas sp. MF1-12-2]|uniref:hypothetical protein n=1 Tax=Silicimonas sp. MF1-12-2 TaxID=3384793 RepID=UPI0039B3D5F4
MRYTSIIPVFLVLSACGGGGGGGFIPGPQAFTDIVNEYAALEAAAGADSVKTPVNTGAVSGTQTTIPASPANYSGFIVIDSNPGGLGDVHYSRIELQADFNTNTLTTRNEINQQFWYYDEVAGGADAVQVGGSVNVSTNVGGISFDDPTSSFQEGFALNASGSVELNGGLSQDITAADMEGIFAGDSVACGSTTGNCAGNLTYFGAVGTLTFDGSGDIATRILTDLD